MENTVAGNINIGRKAFSADVGAANVPTSGNNPGDFVTNGLIRAKDTVLEMFQGSNIYLIIFLIVLFLGIAFYVYTNYISPIIQPGYVGNNELNEKDISKDEWGLYPEQEDGTGPQPPGQEEGKEKTNKTPEEEKAMTMWYFYTDWCPYCKKAKPQWDLLKSMYPDLTSKENGYGINFEEVNGETGANQVKWFEKTFLKDSEKKEIDGYPSIYLVKDSEVFEYEATPKVETFQEFIRQVAYGYKE